jgi:hypothetical protein
LDSGLSNVPIVFEEVTGEITPEREGAQTETPSSPAPGGEEIAATVRREICLMRERERRLRAD